MTPILEVDSLFKAFRGIHAVEGASFSVARGTITGLIGPNGSGKSTTVDCISGFQRLDSGRVILDGHAITGEPPQRIARAGLMRTFQTVRVFETFDLVDNLIAVSAPFSELDWRDALLRTKRFRHAKEVAEQRAHKLIDLIGLTRIAAYPASTLSYGQKKLLAFAAAMMAEPKLIVLDEPVAGVNPTRVNEVAAILKEANRTGTSFLIIEHNVAFITSTCDHVIVFDQGKKLIEGAPDVVHNDARVLEAYLGVKDRQPSMIEPS